ncbi:ABC transporter substrate-binding protein [Carbonactinospora thermoautotrophica]|uniref:sugar ABC transporter substrate-binding protein n=1 Tax=Carbonactinospora thermoautotrophica TaxID=1469144 RepID=UPI00226F6828|nr:sugar ABC transporter substrate-binding protein [Carbonactinospora thermoautotrophica]MCX9190714.1 ABC transporter substrate-binding protein [Carbonactinospora thermoautotrophica]
MERFARRTVVAGTALVLALSVAGCGQQADGGGKASVEEGFKVGLLLPESKTARYEAFDKPIIEKNIKALCAKCEVLYQNAQQDAAKQQTQADSLLSQGVKVLILDAVDAKSAGGIVTKAKQQGVPVVAYDRFASGPVDYFVTFDNRKVGEEQGKALLEALQKGGDPKRGQVVMINGSPTDPNAADFKAGAHSVLDGKVNIGAEYDTPDWSPDKAQQEMEQAITKLGADKIIGVYAANDGTASGAIAALKARGVKPLPPVTGQDAELAAIQRIIAGDQYMTIYKPYAPEAETAAKMAIAAATGQKYAGQTQELTNGSGDKVSSVLLPVVRVTKENVKDTVIKDGVYTVDQICTPQYQAACRQAGIS